MYTLLLLAEDSASVSDALVKMEQNPSVGDIYVVCSKDLCRLLMLQCEGKGISKVQAIVCSGRDENESILIGLYSIDEMKKGDPPVRIKILSEKKTIEYIPRSLSTLIEEYG